MLTLIPAGLKLNFKDCFGLDLSKRPFNEYLPVPQEICSVWLAGNFSKLTVADKKFFFSLARPFLV
jgi:hypothetical protein